MCVLEESVRNVTGACWDSPGFSPSDVDVEINLCGLTRVRTRVLIKRLVGENNLSVIMSFTPGLVNMVPDGQLRVASPPPTWV